VRRAAETGASIRTYVFDHALRVPEEDELRELQYR
jgi:hypothetical protein